MYNLAVITAKNVTKTYGDRTILDQIDFKIGGNRKIGLVGRNGCGKSTLFKVVTKLEELTDGAIETIGEVIGYIPQEFDFPDELVGEYFEKQLESKWDFYKIDDLVSKIKFDNFDPYQKISTMSEGQKMKVKLIEMLLKDPTTLFIDEPTNHLDIEGIVWFENYIKHLPVNVVMISHDREFLNNTVDEIWEIENAKLLRFVGNYDNYKTEKLKLINKWNEEYILFLKKKAQLEKLLENVHKISDGKRRGRAVNAAKKRIDREVVQNKKEKYESKKMKTVNFETEISTGKLVIKFTNVTKAYVKNKNVFEDMNFEIRGKEKVWLFGPNGAGKSTIVKMIMGIEPCISGEVKIGNNVSVGYFSQTQALLDSDKNLLDEFCAKTGCFFGEAYGHLNKFLFNREEVRKRIWQLSPGERARFAFAIFAYENYDLLILDEPDNHLDIETKEVIEESLRNFNGTLLLVSHDRYFVESVGVDKILNLRAGELEVC